MRATIVLPALAFLLLAWIAPTSMTDGDDHGPLESAMEELQSGQRKLRKIISDPAQKDACLETLRSMQRAALTTIQNPIESSTATDEKAKAVWRIGFQIQATKLMVELLACELAVVEGRTDDAAKHYKELNAIKKAGHNAYQEE